MKTQYTLTLTLKFNGEGKDITSALIADKMQQAAEQILNCQAKVAKVRKWKRNTKKGKPDQAQNLDDLITKSLEQH